MADPEYNNDYLRDCITNGKMKSGMVAWGKTGQLKPSPRSSTSSSRTSGRSARRSSATRRSVLHAGSPRNWDRRPRVVLIGISGCRCPRHEREHVARREAGRDGPGAHHGREQARRIVVVVREPAFEHAIEERALDARSTSTTVSRPTPTGPPSAAARWNATSSPPSVSTSRALERRASAPARAPWADRVGVRGRDSAVARAHARRGTCDRCRRAGPDSAPPPRA